jgi:hypothetical protein
VGQINMYESLNSPLDLWSEPGRQEQQLNPVNKWKATVRRQTPQDMRPGQKIELQVVAEVHDRVLAEWSGQHQLIQKCQPGPDIQQEPNANPRKRGELMEDQGQGNR